MAVSGPTWCIEGVQKMADQVFKEATTPEVKRLVLFSNDLTITSATEYANLTVITTNGGVAQTLTAANWELSTSADPVVSEYLNGTGIAFSISGALSVYGWAVVGASDVIYCAENWGEKVLALGDTLTVNPIEMKFDIL